MSAVVTVNGSNLGTSLQELLMADEIVPGAAPSYQLCKTIYLYHPLGAKMAESPITMAQCQEREISVPASPEARVKDAFVREWRSLQCDEYIHTTASMARVYGIATLALMVEGLAPNRPADYRKLWEQSVSFNVLDPLNTSGSLVLSQDPNAFDFQKPNGVAVSGIPYHRSRAIVKMNEKPIYIGYSTSAFGYVGRSTYQRALFPLKSFVQSMITDDMVTRKAGVLIAALKGAGSIVDNIMAKMTGIKRQLIKEAQTDNVISITAPEERIETLNMQNLDGAFGQARKDILENIAAAGDMPAQLLNNETFAEGFGEGSEDAKKVARYIDRVRVELAPLYAFMDKIVQFRAWSPAFYDTIQREFPEYRNVPYVQAFYTWVNSFSAVWPSLLTEPDSEKIKTEETKLRAITGLVEVLLKVCDPQNKAAVLAWAADNFNENKMLFPNPLILDIPAIEDWFEKRATMQDEDDSDEGEDSLKSPPGLGTADSAASAAAVTRLIAAR